MNVETFARANISQNEITRQVFTLAPLSKYLTEARQDKSTFWNTKSRSKTPIYDGLFLALSEYDGSAGILDQALRQSIFWMQSKIYFQIVKLTESDALFSEKIMEAHPPGPGFPLDAPSV